MRLLLVEDEPEFASALCAALKKHDMIVDRALTVAQAMDIAMAGVHGAVLLDRRLPDGDGLSLIPLLRGHGKTMPVIVLTARGNLAERIAGLDGGADDYLAKPFALEELLARLRAVLRRPGHVQPDTLGLGRLTLDVDQRDVRVDGMPLDLPRRELLVLEALMRRMGRMVPRPALMEAVFGLDDDIQANTLDTHISRLRRKLLDAEAGVVVNGIRGVGYVLREVP
ncbi:MULTISPECIES: response regulator transcription factor [Phyllobacteriaceae]|jgi:DNA-binding response OmpR family regulator|uniref:DNA-binding response regulator n=1 Tax=Mesorhizobium hungaricum TaxID=1566387 RepID=A0A1C2DID5_9HYPH|nr:MULTISPECIES: response regulator transcription factor [Mesorhizobium]MBN9234534.1 response regulator transcription factor [Mesorhizobium sp.]MDQ0332604.1 DNA-binding response OmpR family regulator [Mesorhizobium sp. YL-MeA3-2017]OCX14406.1 DNA-binding response regulator [Mesorhizobium hungaricum]